MTAQDRPTLKGYFNTGDIPTETQFANLIDSDYHKDDLGWADYADSVYTSGSPFSLAADTDTILPNNGANGPKGYAPDGVTLYDTVGQKITGIEGETRLITIDFKVVPTSAAATYIEVWIDIGGAVGELYRRINSFPKGSGSVRNITLTTYAYTLNTWEANGGSVYVRSNGPCNIYDIRYVIGRTTKVF